MASDLIPRTTTEEYLARILDRLDRLVALLEPAPMEPAPPSLEVEGVLTEAPKPGPARTRKAAKTT